MKKFCQNCQQNFSIDSDDLNFYSKINVPTPTFCWLCRAQRRMAFRNERILYKRKSDFPSTDSTSSLQARSHPSHKASDGNAGQDSNKDIFSMYSADSGYKVYEKEIWLTDQWDPLTYGRDYDFNRPFFEQFDELLHAVPLKNLNVVNGVNSDYSNNFTEPKNCYLCFNGNQSEDCMYSHGLTFCRDCVDVSHLSKCETCYDSFWLTSGTRNVGCNNCESCFNMWFSKNCVGCSDCVGCVGLRKKQYHIFNEQYSREEYQTKLKELNLGSYREYQKVKTQARDFWLKFPNKFLEGLQNTNVSGNYIDHSKNVRNSFIVREGENLKFCQYVQELPGSKDCYDWSIWGDNGQLMYECHACGVGTQNVRFCLFTQENSHDIEYSMVCSGSSYLFGCVGLRKKQYCILNKQYSKEEYEVLRGKIIQHMNDSPYYSRSAISDKRIVYRYGEFFPPEISPVGYNESMAQEYFPLGKEEAVSRGYKWRDPIDRNYQPTLQPENLPENINEAQDSITNEIISCSHAGTSPAGGCNQLCVSAFRITPDELNFYRKLGVPLPRLCHNCRTFERLRQRTGLELFRRRCQCKGANSESPGAYRNATKHFHGEDACPNEFETAYKPGQPGIVYCEECYQAEIF